MIKPCGLVCCVAHPYALAILCPVASVALLIALCSPPRLSSHLCCCHRRYLNLAQSTSSLSKLYVKLVRRLNKLSR